MRTGGQILVDQLALNGVARVFMVPGESFLPALDALHDCPSIDVILCRHEGGAAMMAEATARFLRGAHAEAGRCLRYARPRPRQCHERSARRHAGGTPLLLLVGLPPTGHEGRGGFQEMAVEPLVGTAVKSGSDSARRGPPAGTRQPRVGDGARRPARPGDPRPAGRCAGRRQRQPRRGGSHGRRPRPDLERHGTTRRRARPRRVAAADRWRPRLDGRRLA